MSRWLAAAIAALLVAGLVALRTGDSGAEVGSGGGPAPEKGADAPAGEGPGTAAPGEAPAAPSGTPTTVAPTTSTTVRAGAQAANAPSTTVPAGGATTTTYPMPAKWDYDVSLSRTCVARGESITITFRLVPGAAAGYIVGYSDARPRGTDENGEAGPDGIYQRTWKVPLDAPPGGGTAATSAFDIPGNRSGSKALPFRVLDVGQSC